MTRRNRNNSRYLGRLTIAQLDRAALNSLPAPDPTTRRDDITPPEEYR